MNDYQKYVTTSVDDKFPNTEKDLIEFSQTYQISRLSSLYGFIKKLL